MIQTRREVYELLASTIDAYHRCVSTDNTEWRDRHEQTIKDVVKEHMPSGAGFDNGTKIEMSRSTDTKLVFRTAFHHMDEGGSYDGWTDHVVTVTPSFGHGFDIKVAGEDRDGIKDHVADAFLGALETEVVYDPATSRWLNATFADKPVVPTVHLNGTDKQSLLDSLQEAIGAVEDAGKRLARGAPHMRDYYVQADKSAFGRAQDQHEARLNKLSGIVKELETIAEGVVDQ